MTSRGDPAAAGPPDVLARANVPTVPTSFIGRRHEIDEIEQALRSSRLVTLTGAAGCGKTRLALRIAANTGSHEQAVRWVALAPLADPRFVVQAVARAANVAEQPGRPLADVLLEALREERLLLVLDNCEHLVGACAQLVEALLTETDMRVLATSREPLKVVGEALYPVPPLPLPPATLAGVEDLGRFDVVRLFCERAHTILPAFELTPENTGAVAGICRRLDGVPLAIEMTAACVNVLTVEEIASRLDTQLELPPPATRVASSHHHTLRAAIDWSHALLSEPEQILMRRLSVFAAGTTLTTIQAVCVGEGIERERVPHLLASLVNKSLVVADTLAGSEAHYTQLATIQHYAREKLSASGETTTIHERHLECFLQMTGEATSKLLGRYQQLWLSWLESEYDNIRSALSWALESRHVEMGLRIANNIYPFWTIRDYVEEGLDWLERLLAHTDESTTAVVHANALAYATFLAGFRGNVAAQVAHGQAASALAAATNELDKPALRWALNAQAIAARAAGDHHQAYAISQRVVSLSRGLVAPHHLGLILSAWAGTTAMAVGEYDVAQDMLDEALPLLREAGDPYRIAMALKYSGDLARCRHDPAGARDAYQESMTLLREIGAERDLASVVRNLGHACFHLGEPERARTLFDDSLASYQSQGNTPGMAACLVGYATLAVAGGVPAAAARLLAAAVAASGRHITSDWAATRMEYEACLANARDALTAAAFEAEQEAGRRLPLERAAAYAREMAQRAAAARDARTLLFELTARERQVAALIAQALSNDEIAMDLAVSKRTVEKHIANIRSKLGFDQRAQIVRWAIESGLVDVAG